MAAIRSETFFLDIRGGRRFCILHRPVEEVPVRGGIVHIHAFAEEMNKSRRTVALASRALAAVGWYVLLLDLDGCGDSSGEFEDADWTGWVEDALYGLQWLQAKEIGEVWLWGHRAGCLIAGECSLRSEGRIPLLLWQPVVNGKLHLTQFLRLKIANEALAGVGDRSGTNELRARLIGGEQLEIAGYALGAGVGIGLDRAQLRLDDLTAPLRWCEVNADGVPGPALAGGSLFEAARSRNVSVDTSVSVGPPFWQTVEITECLDLVRNTVLVMAK